jgi:hypothetical protein
MISRKCFEVMPAATPAQAMVADVEASRLAMLHERMAGSNCQLA